MGADTKIEWAHHSWSPWVGCTKVSPACDNCYAESWAKRAGSPELWQDVRRRTSAVYWQQPLKWNRQAEKTGTRLRVFPSLCDPFDNQATSRARDDMWHRIEQTPFLDWLLLTKRPQNIVRMLPDPRTGTKPWGDGWPNVWLGTTVENQAEADRRIPHLLAVPAAKRFLSCEPLLGPVDLGAAHALPIYREAETVEVRLHPTSIPGNVFTRPGRGWCRHDGNMQPWIDWIIAGGESGPKARPSHPDWFRSLRDQCQAAGVPFFFKQWGEWTRARPQPSGTPGRYALAPRTWPGPITPIDHYPRQFITFGSTILERVGKKAAGATLDSREWREVPA